MTRRPKRITDEAAAWRLLAEVLERADVEEAPRYEIIEFGLCATFRAARFQGRVWGPTHAGGEILWRYVASRVLDRMVRRLEAHMDAPREYIGIGGASYLDAVGAGYGTRALFCWLMAEEADDERRARAPEPPMRPGWIEVEGVVCWALEDGTPYLPNERIRLPNVRYALTIDPVTGDVELAVRRGRGPWHISAQTPGFLARVWARARARVVRQGVDTYGNLSLPSR